MEFTFFQNLEKGVRDACEEFGYEYIMIDQNQDPQKMVQDINSLIGQKVDGIVITPVDPGAIGPVVQSARDAGIPVTCADIGKTGPVNALLISNNYLGGEIFGFPLLGLILQSQEDYNEGKSNLMQLRKIMPKLLIDRATKLDVDDFIDPDSKILEYNGMRGKPPSYTSPPQVSPILWQDLL